MFGSKLRLVPWKNKAEWLKVYEDAYSSYSNRQINACQTMEIWLLLRKDVPPGVECTLNILSALQQESTQAPRQLQLILSTAVLRVVNMLCDNARQSDKETIYSIAKYYNLPDWIVNLRHDVSHGSTLPDLSALKRAATFLLEWLREYYWKIEKAELKDLIIKRSRKEICTENVQFYLDSYVELSSIKFKEPDFLIKNLDDENLMYSLLDINKRSGLQCAIECLPWIRHSRDSFAREIPTDEILSMKISKFLYLMLQQLQDYVTKSSFWQFDLIPLIINAIKKNYYECKCNIDAFITKWEIMIQKLNECKVLDRIMIGLCAESCLNDEGSFVFFSELSNAVTKRYIFDQLKSELSCTTYLSSDSTEQDLASNLTLKKQLNLSNDAGDKAIKNKLFNRVEKRYKNLKTSPRLNESVNYIIDKCTALKLIKILTLNPNKDTIDILNNLFIIVNPNFSESKKENIKDLILVKLGVKPTAKINLDTLIIRNVSDLFKNENSDSRAIKAQNSINNLEMEIDEDKCQIVRSGWDFSSSPLGITPWELEGSEYYHKPYDSNNPAKNTIFPISRPKL